MPVTLFHHHEIEHLLAEIPVADRPRPVAKTLHGAPLYPALPAELLSLALDAERALDDDDAL